MVARLSADRTFVLAFAEAFPEQPAITPDTVARAIATYERTLISPLSPFDAYVVGDANALSPEAKRGFDLFTGRARCATCHTGWAFTNGGFHDIGLTDDDLGRGALTLRKISMTIASGRQPCASSYREPRTCITARCQPWKPWSITMPTIASRGSLPLALSICRRRIVPISWPS